MRNIVFTLALTAVTGPLFAVDVTVGDTLPLPPGFGTNGAFTVSIWGRFPRGVNARSPTLNAALLWNGTRANGQSVSQFALTLRAGRPEFKYFSPNGTWHGIMRNDVFWCGAGLRVPAKDLPRVENDTWFRVTGVYDHGTVALYLDDKPYLMTSNNVPAPANHLPVRIGVCESNFGGDMWNFPGRLALPRFVSRALNAAEIAADVATERPTLPRTIPPFDFNVPSMDDRLPREVAYAKTLPTRLPPRPNCVVKIAEAGGVPRVTIDGVPQAAMAMLPLYSAPTNETMRSARDFAAYGVRFFSDIQFSEGKRNDWWLGEGQYDWNRFEARMRALLAAAPNGWVFPRIKIDPPDWWRAANAGEFMSNARVTPNSAKWRALYTRMLRDVVAHIESSELAGYVMGYQFGAYVGGEWLVRTPESDPQDIADAILLAAGVIKEVTQGRKLTGLFFGYGVSDHEAFGRLLTSPLIDYYCGPTAYTGRRGGEPGRFSSNAQASMRLHGRLYWDEADLRTSICREVIDYRCADMDETVNCVKRAIGWMLTAGEEVWWFAIAGNECFHDERLMEAIGTGRQEEERTLLTGGRPVEDIAFFDPPYSYARPGHYGNTQSALRSHDLPLSGYTYGTYALADLAFAERLPAHKLALVPRKASLTEAERAACATLAKRGMAVRHLETKPDLAQLRAWAQAAGAHRWIESDDTIAAGRGYLMVHARTAGVKTLHLPHPADVTEIYGTSAPRTGVTTFTDEIRRGETKIYRLSPPQR